VNIGAYRFLVRFHIAKMDMKFDFEHALPAQVGIKPQLEEHMKLNETK
jgi:uncharacterized protein YqcC (DUF446 family)